MENIKAKLKRASLADMVIIGTQLAQATPGAGSVVFGIDELASAYS